MTRFRTVAALAALLMLPMALLAQDAFPSRPIRLVIPWPPGGATDIQMRVLAQLASRHLGQPIVIENKPGAGGTIGPASVAASAKPDGYTLTQLNTSVYRQMYIAKTNYTLEDFTYIMGVSAYTLGVVVRADSPFQSLRDLFAFARANPGKVSYATWPGSPMYIVMETIAEREGARLLHVPTKGTADNNALVMGGEVTASADGAGWASLVNAGKFRLLATWGERRSKPWPTVPTLRELGYDIVESSPYGIGGPRGMDPKVVKILYDAFRKALYEPEHLRVLEQLNQETMEMTPEQLKAFALRSSAQQKVQLEKFGLAIKE
ncbi:MAG: tripartite tricarboxylate transporter substrate binding protein [Burkholderiales bacterium]|nr:tripartite tricarboxylate transporter substrate binding protein [Burkholderiales bacterium]